MNHTARYPYLNCIDGIEQQTNKVKCELLTPNGSCRIMVKVAHFVFTTHYSKDHNFYTRPWNDTIEKYSFTKENYVFGHRSVVTVLCLLFSAIIIIIIIIIKKGILFQTQPVSVRVHKLRHIRFI